MEHKQSNQIDLKEVVKQIKAYYYFLKKKWIWLLLAGIFGAGIYLFTTLRKPAEYEATLTFMINEDEGGGGGGIGAILGQFGFSGGGGGYNYLKILEIAKSDLMMMHILFDSCQVNNKGDLVANHLLNFYDYHEKWEDDTLLSGYLFQHPVSAYKIRNNQSTKAEKIAAKSLIYLLRGDPKDASSEKIIRVNFGEENGILNIQVTSRIEELSLTLPKLLYSRLSDYYIQKTTERQEATYKHLEQKSDSIYRLLAGAENRLANYADQSRGIILNRYQLPKARSQRDIEMYSLMYGEALKSEQTAEFLLKSQTPFFQLLDQPFGPLNNVNKVNIIVALIYAILTVFTLAIILVLYKFLRLEFHNV